MFALEAAVEAFRVQNAIHVGSARPSTRIWRIGPQSCKGVSIFSAAFEARPVTGGKSGYFVEEEKLGIVLPPYLTMTSIEFQAAEDKRYKRVRKVGSGFGGVRSLWPRPMSISATPVRLLYELD